MKIVKKNVVNFYAFLEKHKNMKRKKRLKTKKELELDDRKKVEQGIENIKNNIANDTNKLCR